MSVRPDVDREAAERICQEFGLAYTSFLDLARHTRAISVELAERLAPSTGLRSRLAHGYDETDHAVVHAGLRDALELFPAYVAAIEAYLSAQAPQ